AHRDRERLEVADEVRAAVGEGGGGDGVPLVPPHDDLGALALGGPDVGELLEDREPGRKPDLVADRVEVEHRVGERAVEVEDDRARGHSVASGAPPPERATSSLLILLASIPRARLVIVASSSSTGGGSPLMKRRGLVRAT